VEDNGNRGIEDPAAAASGIARDLANHLKRQAELGLEGIDRDELGVARRALAKREGKKRPNPAERLRQIREELGDCKRCKLHEKRTNIVFGEGDPYARIMFIGEGPGEDEDAQGIPFVGKAGKLLTDIIEKGMGLRRSEVYITNVVKSRPPGNRDPEPDEIKACMPFLERQVDVVRPEAIVALGRVAAQALLQTELPIGRLRGDWHEYRGIPLMPTYHPSYLLRSPGAKRQVWEDIKLVMNKLDIPIES